MADGTKAAESANWPLRRWPRLILRGFTLAFCVSVAGLADAHDYWGNGREVDYATKQLCCGQNDCREVAPEAMHVSRTGIFSFDDTNLVIEIQRAMPSPDGRIWRCIWGGEIKCLFVPKPGS